MRLIVTITHLSDNCTVLSSIRLCRPRAPFLELRGPALGPVRGVINVLRVLVPQQLDGSGVFGTADDDPGRTAERDPPQGGPVFIVVIDEVTLGNNGAFSATYGWDPVGGLGSPMGNQLLQALQTTTVQAQAHRKEGAHATAAR